MLGVCSPPIGRMQTTLSIPMATEEWNICIGVSREWNHAPKKYRLRAPEVRNDIVCYEVRQDGVASLQMRPKWIRISIKQTLSKIRTIGLVCPRKRLEKAKGGDFFPFLRRKIVPFLVRVREKMN